MTTTKYKERILAASKIAIDELIKVLEEPIITGDESDLAADRLKNAAATKRLAMFDALDMVSRINEEEEILKNGGTGNDSLNFAESFAK